MTEKQLKKICITTLISYILGVFLFYFIAGDQLKYSEVISEMLVTPEMITGEIINTTVIEQPIKVSGDEIRGIILSAATFMRENIGILTVELLEDNLAVAESKIDIAGIVDNSNVTVNFPIVKVVESAKYSVRITTDSAQGQAITLYYGHQYNLGKGSIPVEITADNALVIDGTATQGMLCYQVISNEHHWFGQHYLEITAAMLVLLILVMLQTINSFKKKKENAIVSFLNMVYKYKFLVVQLVERDFKKKYKRSILGVFWSLLNPILTMTVQYVVFSTLFKSNIENFALYLIIGIVCFSFFSESTSIAAQAITGNASLITKVYMPKAIYPVASIFSSSVNLLISMIPLLLVMLITWTPVRPAVLLIVFALICLLVCSLGFGLLLSALMVFFHDVQFLWSVFTMLGMYITPIFYPITILPDWLVATMNLNPLYHIITFVRTILMNGVSPEPGLYMACIISAAIPFMLGLMVFKKLEDRFILHL